MASVVAATQVANAIAAGAATKRWRWEWLMAADMAKLPLRWPDRMAYSPLV